MKLKQNSLVIIISQSGETADSLAALRSAKDQGIKTLGIVKQNIVFALGVKAIILILGALGIANMWLAVFGDVGVLIIAILNAMRCMRKV